MTTEFVTDNEVVLLRRVNRVLATDTELDGVDLRVFLSLSSTLRFDRFSVVSQVELAKALGRRKEHVSRAMRRLETRGVIVAGSKIGRSLEWKLNPTYSHDTKSGDFEH